MSEWKGQLCACVCVCLCLCVRVCIKAPACVSSPPSPACEFEGREALVRRRLQPQVGHGGVVYVYVYVCVCVCEHGGAIAQRRKLVSCT